MAAVPAVGDKQNPIPVSLVLGAGGARGYAHIGAIEELLASGFAIRAIAGSSMGALIGGIYAAGRLDVYRDWVRPLRRVDVLRMLDWTLSGGGFIKGDKLVEVLKHLIGDVAIDDLPIDYTAVAVDLDTQREVWLSSGPLFDAIRASIAVPAVFRPHRYQGHLLVDGGLLNPLPVAPTLRDLTDYIIAVDVNAPAEPEVAAASGTRPPLRGQRLPMPLISTADDPADSAAGAAGYRQRIGEFVESLLEKRKAHGSEHVPGIVELFTRSLDALQGSMTRLKLAAQPPDLLITVPYNACASYDFHRADELIEIGRQRTREALARWSPPPARWQ